MKLIPRYDALPIISIDGDPDSQLAPAVRKLQSWMAPPSTSWRHSDFDRHSHRGYLKDGDGLLDGGLGVTFAVGRQVDGMRLS